MLASNDNYVNIVFMIAEKGNDCYRKNFKKKKVAVLELYELGFVNSLYRMKFGQ